MILRIAKKNYCSEELRIERITCTSVKIKFWSLNVPKLNFLRNLLFVASDACKKQVNETIRFLSFACSAETFLFTRQMQMKTLELWNNKCK